MTDQQQFSTGEHAARAYAARVGVTGRKGGWLYDARGRSICQGWASFVGILAGDGIIRDTDGRLLATRCDNAAGLRNVFDRKPVVLTARLRRSDAARAARALTAVGR